MAGDPVTAINIYNRSLQRSAGTTCHAKKSNDEIPRPVADVGDGLCRVQ